MEYDKFQKIMEKEKHGDGISVGAGITGEFTLYCSLILGIILLVRVFSDILFAFIGVAVISIGLSLIPMIFNFNKENSSSMNLQLFWISLFCGLLSIIIFFVK